MAQVFIGCDQDVEQTFRTPKQFTIPHTSPASVVNGQDLVIGQESLDEARRALIDEDSHDRSPTF